LLTYGNPPFKLDKSVIATRRGVLEAMGVQFHLGCEIGRDLPAQALLDDYDAVFLGTGATRPVDGRLPGQHLPGVLQALPFLVANARRVLAPEVVAPSVDLPELAGKRVLVLGGGDTAMDCVRTAVRLGAAQVSCVYRRAQSDMPGSRREVQHAIEEGVAFVFDQQPLLIEGEATATGVLFADRDGGAQRSLAADVVILAFGFRASPPPWLAAQAVELTELGCIRTNGGLNGQTSNPRIFAGGDNVRGADLVVTAVRDGRDAGLAIARYLQAARAAA